VSILVDSALTQNELRGSARPAPRNISPRPEKSPNVGVLIVDDEALIRWSLAETLADQGYSVREVGDGKAAIALLENPDNGVRVVMLDYRLPDLTGLQVLAAIRGVSPHTRVVMMTAYGTPEIVAEARRLGAVCTVNKPIEMADVAGLVRLACDAASGGGSPSSS
jgi:DNA-binding NtrC family response regulator